MRYQLIFISIFVLCFTYSEAKDCSSCEPLAEVVFTQKGLSGLSEIVVLNLFDQIKNKVRSKIDMKDIHLDRSSCPLVTDQDSTAFLKSLEEGCMGFDLSDKDPVTGEVRQVFLRPYRLELKNLRMKEMDLRIIDHVKCKDNQCEFKVGVKNVNFKSQVSVNYTDEQRKAIPDGAIDVLSQNGKELVYSFKLSVDPDTGLLNQALRVDVPAEQIKLSDKMFKVSYRPSQHKRVTVDENQLYRKQYELLKKSFQDPAWISKQLEEKYHQEKKNCRDLTYEVLQKEGFQKGCVSFKNNLDEVRECSKREGDLLKQCVSKIRDPRESARRDELSKIKWPEYKGPETFDHLPDTALEIPGVDSQREMVKSVIEAKSMGVDGTALAALKWGENTTNQLLNERVFLDNYLTPWMEKHLAPSIISSVNQELRQTQQYWDKITKVPNLDLQLMEDSNRLGKEIAEAKNHLQREDIPPSEKSSTQERLKILEKNHEKVLKKINNDQTMVQTSVIIDTLQRAEKLTRMTIYDLNSECLPGATIQGKDFKNDMTTGMSLKTLDKYLEMMVAQKKLSFCHGSADPECQGEDRLSAKCSCFGGVQVQVGEKPEMSCEDGDYVLNFKKIDVTKMGIGVQKKIKVELKNCLGSPCFKLKGGDGQFTSFPLNFFFNSFLNDSIDEGLKSADLVRLPIPQVDLKGVEVDSKSCYTKMKWDFIPPEIVGVDN